MKTPPREEAETLLKVVQDPEGGLFQKGDCEVYLTAYGEGVALYSGEIEARNRLHAEQLAIQRNIGERVIAPHKMVSTKGIANLIRKKKYAEALHESTFLGFVGIACGALTARDILGDEGLLHQLVHLQNETPSKQFRRDPADRASVLEMRVPGWPVLAAYL